ncbi:hypothetical protein KY362_04140 [Candidatus Woesearchaeota archaeon]|nr:hypothetical protein [Candidatus Woesearchaeota archaeon]
MDNKILGILMISASLVLIVIMLIVRSFVVDIYDEQIERNVAEIGACHADDESCPHEQISRIQVPIFVAIAILAGIGSLGAYMIFFERSQKEIISTLRKQRQVQSADERFHILLRGMDPEERMVMKAVREQDGITQQTLRLRTDMHKSKLSIVLDSLEKKQLIKREAKGKTKQVFLRIKV